MTEEMAKKSREIEGVAQKLWLPLSLVEDILVESDNLTDSQKEDLLNLLGQWGMKIKYMDALRVSAAVWYADSVQTASELHFGHLLNYLDLDDSKLPDLEKHTLNAIWKFLVRRVERADEKYIV